MKQILISVISFVLLVMLLTGCGSNNTNKSTQENKIINTNKSIDSASSKSTQKAFQTTLTLPDGNTVKPNQTVKWKDLSIQLLVTSLPTQSNSPEKYKEVIRNHSTVISHETVSTSAGNADLVLNERNSPAASESPTTTYEYWVIFYGSLYTYAIYATIIGNKENAKSEVMSLLKQWQVPK